MPSLPGNRMPEYRSQILTPFSCTTLDIICLSHLNIVSCLVIGACLWLHHVQPKTSYVHTCISVEDVVFLLQSDLVLVLWTCKTDNNTFHWPHDSLYCLFWLLVKIRSGEMREVRWSSACRDHDFCFCSVASWQTDTGCIFLCWLCIILIIAETPLQGSHSFC